MVDVRLAPGPRSSRRPNRAGDVNDPTNRQVTQRETGRVDDE
jgi:hypothetical protein